MRIKLVMIVLRNSGIGDTPRRHNTKLSFSCTNSDSKVFIFNPVSDTGWDTIENNLHTGCLNHQADRENIGSGSLCYCQGVRGEDWVPKTNYPLRYQG